VVAIFQVTGRSFSLHLNVTAALRHPLSSFKVSLSVWLTGCCYSSAAGQQESRQWIALPDSRNRAERAILQLARKAPAAAREIQWPTHKSDIHQALPRPLLSTGISFWPFDKFDNHSPAAAFMNQRAQCTSQKSLCWYLTDLGRLLAEWKRTQQSAPTPPLSAAKWPHHQAASSMEMMSSLQLRRVILFGLCLIVTARELFATASASNGKLKKYH
jgi:hypothetical protein